MQYTAARPGPEKLESKSDDSLQIFCDNEHYEFTWTMHHALSSILRKNSPWLDFSFLSNIFIYNIFFFTVKCYSNFYQIFFFQSSRSKTPIADLTLCIITIKESTVI